MAKSVLRLKTGSIPDAFDSSMRLKNFSRASIYFCDILIPLASLAFFNSFSANRSGSSFFFFSFLVSGVS